jgi:hypothetical protein
MKIQVDRIRKFFPAIAFVGGFLWDALTLGKVITTLDLFILLAYWLLGGVVMILMVRQIKPAWNRYFTLALQFVFGGLFSALVVLYFKSSGSIMAVGFVLALIALLVANEFWQEKYQRQWLTWTLYCFSGIMFLNFMIPHVLHSVHPVWFYVSTALGLGVVYGIWRLTPDHNIFMLRGPVAVAAVLIVFFSLNWLPPVPLVLKQSNVCRVQAHSDSTQGASKYSCEVDVAGISQLWGFFSKEVKWQPGTKISYMASVFAPKGLDVALYHRWLLHTQKKGWVQTDKIALSMKGGRQQGWRFYTHKQSLKPGLWRVETTNESGAVLGYTTFKVVEAPIDSAKTRWFSLQ